MLNLLHLEENEFYICDLFVKNISYFDVVSNSPKHVSELNMLSVFLSSKSLILKNVKDNSLPIQKYLF